MIDKQSASWYPKIFGDDWGIYKNRMEWAKREVELACEQDSRHEMIVNCYKSALKVYDILLNDLVNGKIDVQTTKNILTKLVDGTCLTPIEDRKEDWVLLQKFEDISMFQNLRLPSLFKKVSLDEKIEKIYDTNRVMIEDFVTGNIYSSKLAENIIHEIFPIKFPYIPEENPFLVYAHKFNTATELVGDNYLTIGIFYCKKPDGTNIDIYRYFKLVNGDYVKIDAKEYSYRSRNQLKNRYSPWRILGIEPDVINTVDFDTIPKETILELHRALWLWKAEEIRKTKKIIGNFDYFEFWNFCPAPQMGCWLCEYADRQCLNPPICDYCLIKDWNGDSHCGIMLKRLKSLFLEKKWEEAAKLCEEIAEVNQNDKKNCCYVTSRTMELDGRGDL